MSEQLLQQILAELKAIKSEQMEMKTDIVGIRKDMATKEDISTLPVIQQAVMETNRHVIESSATIERIEEGQVRQDRILESLSMRSLEQETELRELRRIK